MKRREKKQSIHHEKTLPRLIGSPRGDPWGDNETLAANRCTLPPLGCCVVVCLLVSDVGFARYSTYRICGQVGGQAILPKRTGEKLTLKIKTMEEEVIFPRPVYFKSACSYFNATSGLRWSNCACHGTRQ